MSEQLKITHNVFDLLVKAKRERNRYREALEKIEAYRVRTVDHPTLAYAEVVEIARAALDGGDEA